MVEQVQKPKPIDDDIPIGAIPPPPSIAPPGISGGSDVAEASNTVAPTRRKADAKSPDLPVPSTNATTSNKIDLDAVNRLHKILIDILDRWLDNLEDQSRRVRESLRSPKYLNWIEQHSPAYYAKMRLKQDTAAAESAIAAAYLNTVSGSDKGAALNYLNTVNTHSGAIEGIRSFTDRAQSGDAGAVTALPFVAATSLVVGTTFLGEAITVDAVSSQTAMNATVFEKMVEYNTALVGNDMRAELGLIGALFATGAAYHSNALSLVNPASSDAMRKSQEFVDTYSKNLLLLVKGEELNKFISSMLTPKEGEADPEKVSTLAARLKVVLLSGALAMLYKVGTPQMKGTGSISGQEFMTLLSPNTETPSAMSEVVGEINIQLAKLTPEDQKFLLRKISDYMDKDPDIKSLIAPTSLFAQAPQQNSMLSS